MISLRTSPDTRPGPSAQGEPLLLTGDPELIGDLHRLAAAAGSTLDVVAEPLDARARWSSAPVVLVGADTLVALAGTGPARRDGVCVVTRVPMADSLFRAALAVGAEHVVELPASETWLVETLTDAMDHAAGRARLVGVIGGCGGAGATTFATALAMAAASDVHPATLVDADPLGAGIERVVGLDDVAGSGWGSLAESAGRLGSRSLRAALPQREGLAVLGWGAAAREPLDAAVVREVVAAAQRGSALVVVDLPRYPDPAASELLLRCDDVVVVTVLTLPAVAATARLVSTVRPLVPHLRLVTRGRATGLDPGRVAETLGLPLVTSMADQRRLEESVEIGLGPLPGRRGVLARAVRATLQAIDVPLAARASVPT
jgi:secretion/DNA translocation related CpaE-like protein